MTSLMTVDRLSQLMLVLIGWVGFNVASFAWRYLDGDAMRCRFYIRLLGLVVCVALMVMADHIGLFVLAWGLANAFLTRLMRHKTVWPAAVAASRMAGLYFFIGWTALALTCGWLVYLTGETSIQSISQEVLPDWCLDWVAVGFFVASATQSALWPFQRWLLSSANAPTPVSAIMHAGLVNGGGFLLVRFAPLLIQSPMVLDALVVLGLLSSLMGTFWKLMQADIKRMWACSTVGQMGYMMLQCGLGLFPAAVAHLCWHGLFKAYLFLASGGVAGEKRLTLDTSPTWGEWLWGTLCGLGAVWLFACVSGLTWGYDTTCVLFLMVLMVGTQWAIPWVQRTSPWGWLWGLLSALGLGGVYGASVWTVEWWLAPMDLMHAQPLSALYVAVMVVLYGTWWWMLMHRQHLLDHGSRWQRAFYVRMLNISQPHPSTVTPSRLLYRFASKEERSS